MTHNRNTPISIVHTAVLTLAAMKEATDAFEAGESNVFDALDSILAAAEAYRAALQDRDKAA